MHNRLSCVSKMIPRKKPHVSHVVFIRPNIVDDDDHEKCVAYVEWIDSMLNDEDGVVHEDEFDMLKKQMVVDGTYYA